MVILLDIDGVMVPASNWKAPELLNDGFPAFSIKAVAGLNKILSATNASILLTTSHRSRFTLDLWKSIFVNRGVSVEVSIMKTAGKLQSRKDEIVDWIQSHQADNFLIIDDDKSLNDLPAALKDKLILTSPLIGLTEDLADIAIEAIRRSILVQP